MPSARIRCASTLALSLTAVATGQTVVEPGWTLIRTIPFDNPVAARVHPFDGRIYVGRRDATGDGLYRITAEGFGVLLASASTIAGVCIDPVSGAIFHAESTGGNVYRTEFGSSGRVTWVSGFHSGDDDPAGMSIAPLAYRGRVIPAGSALVADFGFSGPDEIWRWSPSVAEGETALHTDNGTLVDAYDLAIGLDRIHIVDTGGGANGTIYEVGVGGTLAPLATSVPLPEPFAICVDPVDQSLVIAEASTGRILRVDPTTGAVSEVITNLTLGGPYPAVEVSADGVLLTVSAFASDTIFVFARCDAGGDPALDCDGNGVADVCDLESGAAEDCNGNGVPDSCDIASGSSVDCDGDGIPDDCPQCPPVELVFIMDTSASMDDEAAALCASLPQIEAALTSAGLDMTATRLSICDLPGGAYACLEDTVTSLLGTAVPGNPPPAVATLGACPGGNEVCSEDWGLAAAVVAGSFPWQAPGTSVRLVIPISDEGPWCGNPVNATDQLAIDQAIAVATANGVFVSPITGTGSGANVIALAQQLAAATNGEAFSSAKPSADIAEGIIDLVLGACSQVPRCRLADLDCNGAVNAIDLGILLGSWGVSSTPADIDCSGAVDAADLGILLGAWG